MTSSCESILTGFYLLAKEDHRDRRLESILAEDERWLENASDYIQSMFPCYLRSQFNDYALSSTNEVQETFILSAINRMLRFYGYARDAAGRGERIIKTPDWKTRSLNWFTPGGNNHLWVSRMFRLLTLLGRLPLASACCDRVVSDSKVMPGAIPTETLEFWNEAVETVP